MLDQKTIRKLLMTAVVVALATTPAAAEVQDPCEEKDEHYGLFCNDGRKIEVCKLPTGGCTASCGKVDVPVTC